MNLKEALKNRILVADGAIGTIFYSEGLDTCPESYNLTHPKKVEQIHRSYIEAGADIIQTNTYGANFEKLKDFNLEHRVKEIHREAVQIAKKASNKDTFILGTVGGFRNIKKSDLSIEAIQYHTEIQIETLVNEGVDGILFETYYDLEELLTVLKDAKAKYDIPIIAQLTASNTNYLRNGTPIPDALEALLREGADVVGLNCHHGPYHMIKTYKHIEIPNSAYLSCYPNASLLDLEDNDLKYNNNSEYFSDAAKELVNQGVRLIGGCCGTTPEHIKKIKNVVKDLKPIKQKNVIPIETKQYKKQNKNEPSIKELVQQRPTVIVELDTPKHLDTNKFFDGIQALEDAGVEAVTLADNSLASVRISNIAAASIIKQQYKIRPLVHLACRDRNLIGLQSHLMGLSLLGINDILTITGDPSKVGNFPGATSVFDVNSSGLAEMITQFNQGINADGDTLRSNTNFSVAGAFNPNVRRLEPAVKRLEKKIESGMEYFITQPIYEPERVKEIYEATKHIDAPIFIGIMPITNYNNALFLHNEVPGIKLSETVLNAFEKVKDDRDATRKLSINLSKQLIDAIHQYFNGLYIVTPFLKYDLSVELANYSKSKTETQSKEAIL
ncbi:MULTISPECIES: bifunctional homocysteine S-methyltransferase/methylenetetrahydrofolate reductase [Mammaliicoccus]|uniref:Bifunctional homocysteine S-methyltransferase/methylenetetrahydrofolate reductase n=1 Tax=Mammaliicoccus fleurettii TaxID=150056 RepID=A0ABS5MND9_9STAP|nr:MULTISPECIES: bifunctional homocysteine S-methyltransferase/methylenetetrahydrofolate reductase [Mammaliicoccus]MBL0847738.1 bifunctional homocysteine S-methyltransferase/methylenetetrahydrofolate reductase [Mammaliicoccus fleurettii]MBS3672532.1 bifunctional homocysteine S-methyltransferase/methylenetetrahydrofolate reductase [Mammaliicoccus fleurettii]MBS3697424.1 bifunctional homocysteine S-methyltransferase/methylenetetrahydrofolate reductase [Mammaliicoccus fleurettii]MBW0765489.1 bifun